MRNSDASSSVVPRSPRTLGLGWRAGAAVAVLAVVGALLWLCGSEPRNQGKALSQWLSEFNRIPPEQPAADVEEAIRTIGPKALPFLLSNICATEPQQVSGVRIWINKTFTRSYGSRIDLCAPSWRALSILGPIAGPAIPEITKHAADGPFQGRAMIALAVLGTNSIPALISLCGNPNADVRVDAAFVLAKTKVAMRGVEGFIARSPFSEQPMLAYEIKKGLADIAPLTQNLKHGRPAV